MRLTRSLLAAALALLTLGVSSAQAAVPGLNIGTSRVPGGLVQTPDVDDAKAAGAQSIRVFVDWHLAEPSDDVFEGNRVSKLVEVARYARAQGMTPVFVVFSTPSWANGGADVATPPTNAQTYADFMGYLATQLRGSQPVLEVWNEMDEAHFWKGAPEPARYGDLLKRTKAAVDAADPDATVLFGALTGNNYTFFEQAFDQGGLTPDSFDGVAVHTDTACLVQPPSFYVRNLGQSLDGRINRFSFLGLREVRASMLARGADKPIWMTELGWSSYTGDCEVPGAEPGRKGGVTEEQQAAYTRQAYDCLANYPYVTHAQLFDLRDRGTGRTGLYGILRQDGQKKPAWSAFRSVIDNPPVAGGECGDFTPPAVTDLTPNKSFASGNLRLSAKATDASGVVRINLKVDGQPIRGWSVPDAGNDKPVVIDWFGARQLPPGPHTVRWEALDPQGNVGATEVQVVKLDDTKIGTTLASAIKITKVKVRKGKATITAYVTKTDNFELSGRVQVFWESRRPVRVKGSKKKKKLVWKKVHGGLKSVRIKSTGRRGKVVFTQKLKYSKYRVRVKYLGKAPFKASTSPYRSLKKR